MDNTPSLTEGETSIAIIQITGNSAYQLILLPGDVKDVTHEAATEWAASIGGALPTRYEQALLFAHFRTHFKRRPYWSDQRHESDPDYAWCQNFGYGSQYYNRRYDQLRARAVRRLPIQSFTHSQEATQ